MRKLVRADEQFWAKVAVTCMLVNAPLALLAVVGAMHVGVAVAVSMVSGSVLAAIWGGAAKRVPVEEPARS